MVLLSTLSRERNHSLSVVRSNSTRNSTLKRSTTEFD
jgi:hypothetical protein